MKATPSGLAEKRNVLPEGGADATLSKIVPSRLSFRNIILILLITVVLSVARNARLQINSTPKDGQFQLNHDKKVSPSLVNIFNSTLKEGQLNKDNERFQPPLIYRNIQDVPQFISSGPSDVNKGIPDLYEF